MFAEAQEACSSTGAEVERVGVTRLVLTDFRNYREARLTIGTAPVVLTGPNGAGKTNLLEALSFLAPGRGLRSARLAEIDRCEPAMAPAAVRGWAVAASIATRNGSFQIGTGRDVGVVNGDASRRPYTEKRIVRIDGVPAKTQTALAERL